MRVRLPPADFDNFGDGAWLLKKDQGKPGPRPDRSHLPRSRSVSERTHRTILSHGVLQRPKPRHPIHLQKMSDILHRTERARAAVGAVFMDENATVDERTEALELIASDVEMYLGRLENETEEEDGGGAEAE